MINPTHVGTIEQYAETGDYVDDAETIPVRDWETALEAPCKYEPEGQPFQREDAGGRVYKEARTHWAPYDVGEMVDISDEEEPKNLQYELAIGAGDNWRLTLEGIDGVFAIRELPKVHSSGPGQPTHVTIEIERVDPSELGGS